MSNAWFRMYAEFATDPKVQMLSEAMQRRLVMIFCLRCNGYLGKLSDEEICFTLRLSAEDLAETKDLFIEKNFIDESWGINNWDERQYISDDSKERVRKYREKRKSNGLTAAGYSKHSVTVTERDGSACVYCGSSEKLCIDHILPVSQNGNDDIENLATACKSCNSGKAGRTPEQAGYTFKNKSCELMWNGWMSRRVTVTVTPPDTEQIQNRTEAATQLCVREETFFQKVYDYACQKFPILTAANTSAIHAWGGAGYDFERHIKPAIDACYAKQSTPRSFKFFTAAIEDSAKLKITPVPIKSEPIILSPEQIEANRNFKRRMGMHA